MCSAALPLGARADTSYCSGRCRVAAHRKRGVPPELRQLPRWVRWSGRKVPLTPSGQAASSTNPATWSSHRQVTAAKSVGAGVGFVLNGDGIVCIDLDDCLDATGEPSEPVQRLLELAGATYVEVSPSGRGLHIWGRAAVVHGRCLTVQGCPVEVYPSGRYITVTGRPFGAAPSTLGDLGPLVAELLPAS